MINVLTWSRYVKCELHIEKPEERTGAPIEGGDRAKEGEHKRRTKNSKGVDPDFGGERLQFPIVSIVEELSFLRYVVSLFHSITANGVHRRNGGAGAA